MAPDFPPQGFLRCDTALREQESIPYTEVVECSASVFKEPQSLFTNVCKSINQATKSQEFVYYDLDPDWGSLVSDSLVENDTVEASRARVNFNSFTRTLWVRVMPTEVHECHLNWFRDETLDWISNGLMTLQELKWLKMYSSPTTGRFTGQYQNSRKEPDLLVQPDNQYHPSVVFESGWSESWTRLTNDVRLWLVGGSPNVNVVFLLKWSKKEHSNQVSGFVELYVRDSTGNPSMRQRIVVFPATHTQATALQVTWGEFFGPYLPPGRNPNANLPLNIQTLRREAQSALSHMNMVPV